MASLPPLPAVLKPVQHYLKTATEHEKRDPVVAYYCRLFAVQSAMGIDRKSSDCRAFIVGLMDQLETTKNALGNAEAISNEVVGQAHMENYALKLFVYADNEDRAGRYGKNVVKSFYTAGMLMDVLSTFGELSEDIQDNRKYAKWKAAYIHNCLKNGETPVPGPLPEEGEDELAAVGGATGVSDFGAPSAAGPSNPPAQQPFQPPSQPAYQPPTQPTYQPPPAQPSYQPAPQPHQPAQPAQPAAYQPPVPSGDVQLSAMHYQKAMKYCKFAASALQFEDKSSAVENLTKALHLLHTGQDQ
ncbi:hypothetical protein CAPTEDRAFT_178049 [Capitella teleta]|uniref:Vta1/callose synthase N-terminal domain-containing protein n=1 Tax=Capitella teleta TaxID=283909 RepID=R7TAG9_CAPTE|nr:hypothetical protein CAPTEDRAFT_178049 [Capitella teleta]|eukprot:ELT88009.1 hypothetical protein CAPTEDRAFT_178049 [Capitella teleta]